MRLPAFVCLSVCLQDYSKPRAWIWMKCCVSIDIGYGRTGLLKPPNQDKIVVNEEDVYKQLYTLNENKSLGPDSIHPAVLKKMAGVWTYPLTTLFQNSLQTGTLPSDWLLADVTPIFKQEVKVI